MASKIEKLMSYFEDELKEYDMLLITSDITRRYLTNLKSTAGYVLIFRDIAYLITDFRYIEKARKTVNGIEIIEQEKLFDQINKLIKKHDAKKVAIEADYLTVTNLMLFMEYINAEVDPDKNLSNVLKAMRMVKSEDEIEKIRHAQRIAEKAFDNILDFIKPGKTEREVKNELDRLMFDFGTEEVSFETIALTGKNTAMPHGTSGDTKILNGDFVLFDFGAVYEGYHSDMTRTIAIGEPDEDMREVYDIVLTAQKEALKFAKAGIGGDELDEIARDEITANGYGECFGHSLGHGVGMEIHEQPNASPSSDIILRENMIVTIEPGIYIEGKFGVRIEDFVVIKNNGIENLTNTSKELMILK